jgi:hypothetical protein
MRRWSMVTCLVRSIRLRAVPSTPAAGLRLRAARVNGHNSRRRRRASGCVLARGRHRPLSACSGNRQVLRPSHLRMRLPPGHRHKPIFLSGLRGTQPGFARFESFAALGTCRARLSMDESHANSRDGRLPPACFDTFTTPAFTGMWTLSFVRIWRLVTANSLRFYPRLYPRPAKESATCTASPATLLR